MHMYMSVSNLLESIGKNKTKQNKEKNQFFINI